MVEAEGKNNNTLLITSHAVHPIFTNAWRFVIQARGHTSRRECDLIMFTG